MDSDFSMFDARIELFFEDFEQFQTLLKSDEIFEAPGLQILLYWRFLTPQGQSSERNLPGTIDPRREIFDKWFKPNPKKNFQNFKKLFTP